MKFKAQAEGAVELLVGVIIMSIVLAIAFHVMQGVSNAQCLSQLKSQMSLVRDGLNEIAINSPPVTKNLAIALPNSCGNYKIVALQFVAKNDPSYCRLCGTTFGGCFQAIPIGFNAKNNQYTELSESAVCIDLPGAQKVESNSCPTGQAAISNACGQSGTGTSGCNGILQPTDPAKQFIYNTIKRSSEGSNMKLVFDKGSTQATGGVVATSSGTISVINVCGSG